MQPLAWSAAARTPRRYMQHTVLLTVTRRSAKTYHRRNRRRHRHHRRRQSTGARWRRLSWMISARRWSAMRRCTGRTAPMTRSTWISAGQSAQAQALAPRRRRDRLGHLVWRARAICGHTPGNHRSRHARGVQPHRTRAAKTPAFAALAALCSSKRRKDRPRMLECALMRGQAPKPARRALCITSGWCGARAQAPLKTRTARRANAPFARTITSADSTTSHTSATRRPWLRRHHRRRLPAAVCCGLGSPPCTQKCARLRELQMCLGTRWGILRQPRWTVRAGCITRRANGKMPPVSEPARSLHVINKRRRSNEGGPQWWFYKTTPHAKATTFRRSSLVVERCGNFRDAMAKPPCLANTCNKIMESYIAL